MEANDISISQLRQNLAESLARVKRGEALRVTQHGNVVARIEPALSARDAARARLEALRKTAVPGDVVTPIPRRWSAMHDEWAMNPPAPGAARAQARRRR